MEPSTRIIHEDNVKDSSGAVMPLFLLVACPTCFAYSIFEDNKLTRFNC